MGGNLISLRKLQERLIGRESSLVQVGSYFFNRENDNFRQLSTLPAYNAGHGSKSGAKVVTITAQYL